MSTPEKNARAWMIADCISRYSNGGRIADLATMYMQSPTQIRAWVRDEHYRMVILGIAQSTRQFAPSPDQIADWTRKPGGKRGAKVSSDKIAMILADDSGLSQRKLAKKYGISHTNVRTILKNRPI